ncbi:MAG: response regulator [Symploca sp. SIO2G7]|nr:response regulator [Symploca sp. SIO2G7]
MRILLIEDDQELSIILADVLVQQNYIIDLAKDSQEALYFLETFPYDLLLLDIALPGVDGITFCRQLRSRGFKILILLLTERDVITDQAKGLNAGADEYLIKPFDLQELLAQIYALLRQVSAPLLSTLEWGDLSLVASNNQVTYRGQSLELTPTEYHLLELFLHNPHRVFSYDDLIQQLWFFDTPPSDSTIRSHIRGLRKKLKAVGAEADLIETVHGVGYRLKSGEQRKTSKKGDKGDTPSSQFLPNREQQTLAALRRSWEHFKDSIFADIAFLEHIATNLEQLTTAFPRSQAIYTAHNLVGLLGSLRLAEASKICRKIENLLLTQTTLNPKQSLRFKELLSTLSQVLEQQSFTIITPSEPSAIVLPEKRPLVLIIDDDIELTQQLQQGGNDWGIQIEQASSLSFGREEIKRICPDLIILDLIFPDEIENGLTLLAELSTLEPSIPVLVLTVRGEFSDRLRASRAEAVAFLHKPFSLEKILAIVHQTLQQPNSMSGKILMVDDDPAFLSMLQKRLKSEQLQITTLSRPQHFWEALETVSPDLLILDLIMPDLDGIELCQVVRNDPQWHELPILFLTSYSNTTNMERLFAAGADDFINKSVLYLELQTRIFSHLQRVQRLRQMSGINRIRY